MMRMMIEELSAGELDGEITQTSRPMLGSLTRTRTRTLTLAPTLTLTQARPRR